MAELPATEAHVRCVRTDGPLEPGLLPWLESMLSPDDVQRRRSLRRESDRQQLLLSRALVRVTLSSFTGVDPRRWRFATGPWGKPAIAEPERLRTLCFSLSHTRGLIGVGVVWDVDIGIDLEVLTAHDDRLAVAERFFSPSEKRALGSLSVDRQDERFLEYWTLKEAYSKARGLGLRLPLDQCGIALEPGAAPRLELHPQLGDDPDAWQLGQHRPTPAHLLAYALRRRNRPDLALTFCCDTVDDWLRTAR